MFNKVKTCILNVLKEYFLVDFFKTYYNKFLHNRVFDKRQYFKLLFTLLVTMGIVIFFMFNVLWSLSHLLFFIMLGLFIIEMIYLHNKTIIKNVKTIEKEE